MKNIFIILSALIFCACNNGYKNFPKPQKVNVFENTLVNFSDKKEKTDALRLQNGRLIIKKISAPFFPNGTDVQIQIKLKSNGDSWDKSGSCFVIPNTKQINLISVAKGENKFPTESMIENKFGGVKLSQNYTPAIELLRFMTPFGVGFYSDETKFPNTKYSRPVSVPKWEKEVIWNQDISQLSSLLQGDFYIGVWIDTWTKEGYIVDVSLTYSGRPRPTPKILPLENTIYYTEGQHIPDFFSRTSLKGVFQLPEKAHHVNLHYITTGHGGHSGGDEFVKINNSMKIDKKKVIDFIPWRDDCASFRRFSPTSGVWIQKDSAIYYDENQKRTFGLISERLASSDLSRSNWCPGSAIIPHKVNIGTLSAGKHNYEIIIPATKNKKEQNNHWLVSSYLSYE